MIKWKESGTTPNSLNNWLMFNLSNFLGALQSYCLLFKEVIQTDMPPKITFSSASWQLFLLLHVFSMKQVAPEYI